MDKFYQVCEDFLTATAPLLNPHHAITSERMLARRTLGASGEDRLSRLFARLREVMNGPVVAMYSRRLGLTPLGLALRRPVQQIIALRNREADADEPEALTVAVAPLVPACVITRLTTAFFGEWEGLVQLRYAPLAPDAIHDQLASGAVACGIGLQAEAPDVEPLPVEPLAWSLLVLPDDLLAADGRPATADALAGRRVALPPGAATAPGVGALVARVPAALRVTAASGEMARAMAVAGVAVALDLDFAERPEPWGSRLVRLPVAGPEHARLVLFAPRGMRDLSEPAKHLLDAVRAAASPPPSCGFPVPEPQPAFPIPDPLPT